MNIVLWIAAGILAAGMLMAGLMKASKPKEQLYESGMTYVEDFPAWAIRAIGLAEILGAIGVILPGIIGIATVLVPVAAACLAVTMIGAIIVHVRRSEFKGLAMPVVLFAVAVLVAVGRFSTWAF